MKSKHNETCCQDFDSHSEPSRSVHRLSGKKISREACMTVAAGSAMLLSASVGEAVVIYDLNVNTAFGDGNTYGLDFDSLALPVANFKGFDGGTGYAHQIFLNRARSGFSWLGNMGNDTVSMLASDAVISSGAAGSWDLNHNFLYRDGVLPQYQGQWGDNGDEGYIGFRFNKSGTGNRYGWVQVRRDSSSSGTILAWAYNDTAGQSLKAGQTEADAVVPEPTGLALLACGAAGIYALRRKCAKAAVPSV